MATLLVIMKSVSLDLVGCSLRPVVQIWGHLCKVQFKDWEIWKLNPKRIPMNPKRTPMLLFKIFAFSWCSSCICYFASLIPARSLWVSLGTAMRDERMEQQCELYPSLHHAGLELSIVGCHSWETSAPRAPGAAASQCSNEQCPEALKNRAHEERDLLVGDSIINFLRKKLSIWNVVNSAFTFCTMFGWQDQLQNFWTEYVNSKFLNVLKFQATAALCNCLPIFNDVSIFWYLCTWCKMFWNRIVKQNFFSFC